MARLILSLLLLLSGANIGWCQLTLKAPTLVQEIGDEFIIDIEATEGVDTIAALQFAMRWDVDILEFVDVVDLWLPPLSANNIRRNFGFYNLDSGILTFLWTESSINNISIPDNTTLIRLKFKALSSGTSAFEFVSTNSLEVGAFKALNDTLARIDLVVEAGEVKVNPLALQTIREISAVTAKPNPSNQDIEVSFSYNDPVELTWSVYDMMGKQLHTGLIPKGIQTQSIKIERDIFPAKGVYLFSARSTQGVLSRKLIVQ